MASWEEGPKLNVARSRHSCNLISTSENSDDKTIIVVGGKPNGDTFSGSVEIYDSEENVWKNGPGKSQSI